MGKCQLNTPESSRPDQNYEFFKVYISEFYSNHLQIPRDFTKNFNGKQPTKVALKNLRGQRWVLNMELNRGGLFFKKGWPNFVKDNSLVDGEFLVFRYNERSGLTVRIFGHDACMKEVCVENDAESKTEGDDQLAHNRNNLGKPKRKSKAGSTKASTREMATEDEKERALELAKAFTSENPFFFSAITPWFMNCNVHVPVRFEEYVNKNKEDKFSITLTVSGKSWPIRCSRYCRKNLSNGTSSLKWTRIQQGWPVFATANCLQVGDVCVFELIKDADNCFNVVIFRAGKSVDG